MFKKLHRNFQTGLLGGVASGLSEGVGKQGIPPFFIRLLFIVLFMALGLGLFLYIALWLLLPEKRSGRPITDRLKEQIQKWKRD